MAPELLVISPVLAGIAAGVLALVSDAARLRRLAVWVAVAGLLAGAGLAAYASQSLPGGAEAYGVFIGGGGLSATLVAVFALAALSLAGGATSFACREGGAAAAALIAFGAAAAGALALSTDLIMTIIALETLALCAYALVTGAGTARSAEAGMKYVVQGAVSTGFLLLGVAVLFGLYGGEHAYSGIGAALSRGPAQPVAVAAALVLVAFAFKLGAAPFHSWAPDAFETAPPPAGAFLASAPKIGATMALFIIVARLFESTVANLAYQVAAVAVLSMIVGSLGGLRQTSYTRMLGYSGVAQVGYALAGLVAGAALGPGAVGNLLPLTLVLVVSYATAAVGAFLAAQAVAEHRPGWDGTIAGMAGIGRERPLLGLTLAVCMFSLTGIPLTAGFWGKLIVFGVLTASQGWLWLAILGVVASVVSFGYYGSVLRSAFFETLDAESDTEESTLPERSTLSPESTLAEEDEAQPPAPRVRVVEIAAATAALAVLAGGIVPLFAGIDSIIVLFAG